MNIEFMQIKNNWIFKKYRGWSYRFWHVISVGENPIVT